VRLAQVLSDDEIENHYLSIEQILKTDKNSTQEIKEHILKIAYKMDEKIRRGEFLFMQSDICSTILRTLRDRGMANLQITVYRMFSDFPQFKRGIKEDSSIHSLSSDKDLPVESSVTCEEYSHALDVLERAEVDRIPKIIYDGYRDRLDDVKDRDDRHYQLNHWVSWDTSEEDKLTALDKMNKTPRNHMKKPEFEGKENPLLAAMEDFDQEFHRLMDNVKDYPMPDREMAIRCGHGWIALKTWLRPWTDKKWRADRYNWFLIKLGLKGKSIHAMQRATSTPDINNTLRHITKEQISDNQFKIVEYAIYLMERLPGIFETTEWFSRASLPYRKDLTVITAPKLIKKA